MTRASLWHHNGNQDVTKEAAVTMVCGHAFHSGWFEVVYERFSAYTHPNLHKFNMLWGIMIESKLIPRFRSLWCHQRPGKLTTALGLWWASQVVGDTTMTSILVSIPIAITWNNADWLSIAPLGTTSVKSSKCLHFHSRKCDWKYRLPNWWPLFSGGDELTHAHSAILQKMAAFIFWMSTHHMILK